MPIVALPPEATDDPLCDLLRGSLHSSTTTYHLTMTSIISRFPRGRSLSLRTLSTTSRTLAVRPPPLSRPGPPPLPKEEQAEFEALFKAASTVGGTPAMTKPAAELQHPDLRRKPKPDFEGDVNPKTGEMGGPKKDPFLAGDGDWQYAGRVTVSSGGEHGGIGGTGADRDNRATQDF